ncbi:hypothetical protein CVD28_04860 [Bacillus sp. M6-12]|uniref:hypothetical protein n=1 Tax=Bacillus sp. M6-12 TaxID=2054166 RepID=UPI000C763D88|nr:hypothetical protein [Bacillus sp. M6-12]PLS19744.1 hypothetical protein CVD28_04860 [Bacillus sp. M6-12]
MNQLMNFLRKRNDGYVSIEVVIIGGLVVGAGAFAIQGLHVAGTEQVETSVSTVEDRFNSIELLNGRSGK